MKWMKYLWPWGEIKRLEEELAFRQARISFLEMELDRTRINLWTLRKRLPLRGENGRFKSRKP